MGGQVKNQHYVPRMYIKRFSPDKKRICVWNLMKDTILIRQRPENYAAKRYFYDASKAELKQALKKWQSCIQTLFLLLKQQMNSL